MSHPARRGFTLIEVVIAIIILGVVALGLGRFVGNFQHMVGTSTVRTSAVSIVQERMELIRSRSSPTQYATIVATYGNTTTAGFPGYPAMVVTTRAVRTQTAGPPRADYTTITVTATEPTMGAPVAFTTVMAAP